MCWTKYYIGTANPKSCLQIHKRINFEIPPAVEFETKTLRMGLTLSHPPAKNRGTFSTKLLHTYAMQMPTMPDDSYVYEAKEKEKKIKNFSCYF